MDSGGLQFGEDLGCRMRTEGVGEKARDFKTGEGLLSSIGKCEAHAGEFSCACLCVLTVCQ